MVHRRYNSLLWPQPPSNISSLSRRSPYNSRLHLCHRPSPTQIKYNTIKIYYSSQNSPKPRTECSHPPVVSSISPIRHLSVCLVHRRQWTSIRVVALTWSHMPPFCASCCSRAPEAPMDGSGRWATQPARPLFFLILYIFMTNFTSGQIGVNKY
jgi:hypothetical protein